MHRCRISIQHLPVLILDSLPLVATENNPVAKLSGNTIYMKLLKHPGFYLIYELQQVGSPAALARHCVATFTLLFWFPSGSVPVLLRIPKVLILKIWEGRLSDIV